MRGVGMSQRMEADLLAEVDLLGDLFDRSLHGRGTGRCGGRRSVLFTGELVVSAIRGEQQSSVPVRDPVLSQQIERRSGKWNIAILGALASMHVDHHSLGIDVAHLQIEPFLHPQAERVDGPEVDRHPLCVRGAHDLQYLGACDDFAPAT